MSRDNSKSIAPRGLTPPRTSSRLTNPQRAWGFGLSLQVGRLFRRVSRTRRDHMSTLCFWAVTHSVRSCPERELFGAVIALINKWMFRRKTYCYLWQLPHPSSSWRVGPHPANPGFPGRPPLTGAWSLGRPPACHAKTPVALKPVFRAKPYYILCTMYGLNPWGVWTCM